MNKSVIVHLKNKYPSAQVLASEDSVSVVNDGELIVSLVKDGGGSWKDNGVEMGARDAFDLAPIPKDSRVHKLFKDGRIGLDEKAESRKKLREKYMVGDRVASCDELQQGGKFEFDEKQVDKKA